MFVPVLFIMCSYVLQTIKNMLQIYKTTDTAKPPNLTKYVPICIKKIAAHEIKQLPKR